MFTLIQPVATIYMKYVIINANVSARLCVSLLQGIHDENTRKFSYLNSSY